MFFFFLIMTLLRERKRDRERKVMERDRGSRDGLKKTAINIPQMRKN